MIDENDLLTEWAAGGKKGEAAFTALYAKYNKKVIKDAKKLGGDPSDTSQNVWLRLAEERHKGTLPSFGKFEAYLYRLTQMACGRDAVDAGEPPSTPLHDVGTADLPASPSTEDVVMASQLSELVSEVVDTLPEALRNAWAHKRRGDTDAFAAGQLGVSERTYRERVANARAIISESLAKHG